MPVYSYGLMLVIGVLAGIWVAKILARRRGMDPELFVNAGLLALLSGIVGARLSHVLENWGHYTRPGVGVWGLLWEAVNIRGGGLTYYGGFIFATVALIVYARHKKVNVLMGMDIIAPCLMIGLAFGRIGCLLNGCCYGALWNSACALEFPYGSDAYVEQVDAGLVRPPEQLVLLDAQGRKVLMPLEMVRTDPQLVALAAKEHALGVHPTEVYSSITAFLIAALLLAYMPFNKSPGRVFALMLMVEPVTRFLIEAIRVEPAVWGPLSFSMVLAIPQLLVGVGLWIAFKKRSA